MSAGDVSENLSTAAGTGHPSGPALGIAGPVPVGIAGFAMTTFILSCVNAGFFGGTAAAPMVLGLAIFYGGLVQLLAGMWAFRRGETFVAVAFAPTAAASGCRTSSWRTSSPRTFPPQSLAMPSACT